MAKHLVVGGAGRPARYTEDLGGYEKMLAHHRGLAIAPDERHRFVSLLGVAADDAGLPDDPEFRSALIAYARVGIPPCDAQLPTERPRSSSTHLSLAGVGAEAPPLEP